MRTSRLAVALAAVACAAALPAAAVANGGHGNSGKHAGKGDGTLVRLAPVAGQTAKGKAVLKQRTGALSVKLRVSGLAPGSWHAVHLHAGSCAAQGAVVLPFPDIYADERGVAKLVTTLPTAAAANFVAAGYYINVHAADGTTPGITCGDVIVKTEKSFAKTWLKGAGHEHGAALVEQKGSDVSVWLKLSGLTPGAHAVHIHAGTCAAPGAVAVSLGDVTAGPDGTAFAKIAATSSIPVALAGFSLDVHAGASATTSAVVACGDLRATDKRGHKRWHNKHDDKKHND
jgi:Cu/Zn superoxide dismutase